MEEVQQSNPDFIIPIIAAYAVACSTWFILYRYKFEWWPIEDIGKPDKKYVELIWTLMGAVGVIVIGRIYAAGYLIPKAPGSAINNLIWPLNNMLIYGPIFLVVLLRKQPMSVLFLSPKGILKKLLFGAIATVLAVMTFLILRNELVRVPEIIATSVTLSALSNFPAVFLEGVALAFIYIRLKWSFGTWTAILAPSLLFAAAHVPGSVAEGDSLFHIIVFFMTTSFISTFVLYTMDKSRDVIWLGVVHYFLDVAIKAF